MSIVSELTVSEKVAVVADDTSIVTRQFDEQIDMADSPRHRRLLQVTRDHTLAEALSDLDETMRWVVDDPEYFHFYGPPHNEVLRGRDTIRRYYANMFANGGIGNVARVVNHRFIVADHALAMEITMIRLLPGRRAKAAGYSIADERGHYAVRRRLCCTLPFDDGGLLCGELSYGGAPDPFEFEQVGEDRLSPGYLDWLSRFASDS